MGNDPAGSHPTHMNPFSKANQGWVETMKVTETSLGVTLRPRSVAPDIIEIPLGGDGGGSKQRRLWSRRTLYIEYMSNRVPGPSSTKATYNSGSSSGTYDRGRGATTTSPRPGPARFRMDVVEYDFRDGTQELELNLNRGEPADVWLGHGPRHDPLHDPRHGTETGPSKMAAVSRPAGT